MAYYDYLDYLRYQILFEQEYDSNDSQDHLQDDPEIETSLFVLTSEILHEKKS